MQPTHAQGEQMLKYVYVTTDKFQAPLVIEADTADVKDNELFVKLGDEIVARFPERSVRRWSIEDTPETNDSEIDRNRWPP